MKDQLRKTLESNLFFRDSIDPVDQGRAELARELLYDFYGIGEQAGGAEPVSIYDHLSTAYCDSIRD